jgi:alkylation response protein AidB-like acyl-CoA dehydrogenase
VLEQIYAFRAQSRATLYRLDAGERLGAETSLDKVMLGLAEQSLFDLVAEGLAEGVAFGDDGLEAEWRSEFMYSRAATIYGGSAEIQRNIIAKRLLDLGPEA